MTVTIDFDNRAPGSKRKSLITLVIYVACLVGSVALANFAGRPMTSIPTPLGMAG